MDHEAKFCGIGSPIDIDSYSACETRSRSNSSSATSTSSSSSASCSSSAGDDDKSSEDKNEDEEEEEKEEKGGGGRPELVMEAEPDIPAKSEKLIWQENTFSDEEHLKAESDQIDFDEGVSLNLQNQNEETSDNTELISNNGYSSNKSPSPDIPNGNPDESIDTEDSKPVYKNGSNKQPQTSPNHGKMKQLPLKSGDETDDDQIIKIIHGLIINDDDDVNNSNNSNPVSNESRTPENSDIGETRSPATKMTTKANRKKKDLTDRVTSPGAGVSSPSGGNASPIADVTSPSGGAVRNVGPRLAKEVVAKKDGRKEKKLKDRKEKKETKKKGSGSSSASAPRFEDMHCSYCNVTFYNRVDFQSHCRSDRHQHTIMSDEGRTWKFRPPPRGVGSESYSLCSHFSVDGFCRFSNQCVEAHSSEELREWKERFEYRQKKAQKAAKMYGKSFADMILEKIAAAKNKDMILRPRMDGVTCKCDSDLDVTVSSKNSELSWTFEITTKKLILHNVALLNDSNRHHFSLLTINHVGEYFDGLGKPNEITKNYQLDTENGKNNLQEWAHPDPIFFTHCTNMKYQVKVSFRADIFGTFRQSVIFSFGFEPHLRQDLCVDVVPVSDDEGSKLQELQDILVKQSERWDPTNSEIIDFEPPVQKLSPEDEVLVKAYQPPQPSKFRVTQNVLDPQLTKLNYRGRLHELLFIEEMAQFEQISQFNVVTKVLLTSRYLLMPTSTNSSTAKYARPGELFGKMKLGSSLSEDSSAGRLILRNCSSLLMTKTNQKSSGSKNEKRIAYVAVIEDTGKSTLYLRLSNSFVDTWKLKEDQEIEVEVQFQLNRLPICEMHHAIDKLPTIDLVYPDTTEKIVIPWTPGKQWSEGLNSKLNPKQREAVVAITTPLNIRLPPILIIGPYGTGKTFTLGQAIKMILNQDPTSRVLVCTHSNSAADLYIREYLHPYIEKENPDIKLLRVYYKNRWVQTVHATVLKYCLVTQTDTSRVFRYPVAEDITDCQVVVATLSTSRVLSGIGLPSGHFTHILLDEAAQAMESEAILPFALASLKTRIVLAGDHMQLSPEVFSHYATEKRLNKSLLERLYDHYPQNYPCKILLCENYRSHEAIINYTSELFYDQKLIASGKQLEHEHWYPLTLFTARGEDVQDVNSTSFYNNSEVYEVVERVVELQRTWPKAWGHRDENSIGIVTPYYDQVQRIRSELRKRKLFGVSVERVLNVQGTQFRAIFLSTVRTRKTCNAPTQGQEEMSDLDFGFLSNAKLLNTAITRAQSLVAVVGDPVALCSVGKCRKLWERFVEVCHAHHSLFGVTWSSLRAMLDGVELKKTYVLNPLAPEFVPRAKRYRDTFLSMMTNGMIVHEAARGAFGLAPPYFPGGGPRGIPPGYFSGPPPRPPPPPPPPVNPYVTVPPFPHPAPWMKLPPPVGSLPDLTAGLNFPIQVPPPPPKHHMHPWNAGGMRPPKMGGMMDQSAVMMGGQGLLPRPMSPPRRSFPNQLAIMAVASAASPIPGPMSPRQPNAQFANSKYQRTPVTSMGMGPVGSMPAGLMTNVGGIPRPLMSLSVTPSAPGSKMAASEEPSSFMFLKDGIHFPQLPVASSGPMTSASGGTPINVMPPMQQQNPAFQFSNMGGRPSIVDVAIDLLPHDCELVPFLQSPQLQVAWFNNLSMMRGEKDASLFKSLIMQLQQNPELVTLIKQTLFARKHQHSTPPIPLEQHAPLTQHPPPFMPRMNCPPPPPQLQPPVHEKPPILAQDLEAMLLRESRQSIPPPSFMTSQFLSSVVADSSLLDETHSLNEVLRNDPILSEILHQSDESSPDSGCWGSVNSILNSKPMYTDSDLVSSRFTEPSHQSVTEPRPAMAKSGYVPLYLRRAGMMSEESSQERHTMTSLENQSTSKLEDSSNYISSLGRFTQEPVSSSLTSSFFPAQMFQRQSSNQQESYSVGFSGSSTTAPTSGSSTTTASTNNKPPLTYANVLRNPQLLRESNDPLTRIRNLGTQGNREMDNDSSGSNQQSRLFSYFGSGQW